MRVGFAIPGPIATALSGGYLYDRALIAHAPAAGVTLEPIELPGGFPFPGGVGAAADPGVWAEVAARLGAWEGPLLIDGLAYGALPEALARGVGERTVALVHHPLALETGLSPARAAHLRATERAALSVAAGVVATSETTAATLAADYDVAPERITVAPPGFERADRAPLDGDPPRILGVGAVIRRKRFPELIGALARLADLDWRFRLVGPADADPLEATRLEASLAASAVHGVRDRIEIAGALSSDAVAAAYRAADLFVSAAAYEGYGMAIAEAALRGLPIVAVAGGAARETAAAGVRVDPGREDDSLSEALAAAMRPLIADRSARLAASDRVWAARDGIATPEETARRVAAALRRAFGREA